MRISHTAVESLKPQPEGAQPINQPAQNSDKREQIDQFSCIVRGEINHLTAMLPSYMRNGQVDSKYFNTLAELAQLTNQVSKETPSGKRMDIRAPWSDNMNRFLHMSEVSPRAKQDVEKILAEYQKKLHRIWKNAILEYRNEISACFQALIEAEELEKAILFATKVVRKFLLANGLAVEVGDKASIEKMLPLCVELMGHFKPSLTPAGAESKTSSATEKGPVQKKATSAEKPQAGPKKDHEKGPEKKPAKKYKFGLNPINHAALKKRAREAAAQKLPPGTKVERRHIIEVLSEHLNEKTTGTNESRINNIYSELVNRFRPEESQALLSLFNGESDFLQNKKELEVVNE